jgi:hypothetical protein
VLELGCQCGCVQVVVAVPGPPGPGGGGGGGGGYLHTQSTPATVWVIPHGLGRRALDLAVYSLDYSVQWDGVELTPTSTTTCTLTFDVATAGVAYIH